MNKFNKLLMTITAITSVLGWNIHTTQAQNNLQLLAVYQVPTHTEDITKQHTILIARSRTTYRCYRDIESVETFLTSLYN